MWTTLVTVLAIAFAAAVEAAPLTDAAAALAGTWSLDERASDDPQRALSGSERSDGLGRRVARGVNIFGIPVGSLPRPAGDSAIDPDELAAVEQVFDSTFRLRLEQDGAATKITYGNSPVIAYRDGEKSQHDGATTTVRWEGGVLTVEHELAAGARVSERYWYEARGEELHWTVRLKRRKASPVDIERVFYRAPSAAP